MKVKVTELNGQVIIETLIKEKDADFIPVTEQGKIGSVMINTGKHLGMSKEALSFIKKLKVTGDDIGDVDGFIAGDNKHVFGWLGSLNRAVGPDATLPNNGFQDIDFIEIPNETSQWIIDAIDK